MAGDFGLLLLSQLLASILSAVVLVGEALFRQTDFIATAIIDELGDINGDLEITLNNGIEGIAGKIDTSIGELEKSINGKIDNTSTAQLAILNQIKAANERSNVEVLDAVNRSQLASESTLADIAASIGGIIEVIQDELSVVVNNQIDIDSSLITDVTDTILDVLKGQSDLQQATRQVFQDALDNLINTLLAEAGLEAETAIKVGADIVGAINKVAGHIAHGNTEAAVQAAGELLPEVFQNVIKVLGEPLGTTADELRGQIARINNMGFEDAARLCNPYPDDNQWVPDNPLFNALLNGLMLLLQAVTVPTALAQQRAQICLQNDSYDVPWRLMEAGDTANSLHRGLIDGEAAIDELRRGGFSTERAFTLLASTDTIPDLTLLLSMWFRNEITEDALDSELRALGYTSERIDLIKKIAFFVPPVQDLITMAVREVFSPEIARAQGQFDDFPEDFAFWAKQQGVSEAWAQNYWAAHWSLPSPQMGFEMLQRQVITEAQLGDLLRALDVMPGWRQPLIDISYSPFTRVDIRRMHSIGVLTDAEVITAYRDIGYNEDRAKKLLDFTKKLNDEESLLTLDVASDLTRSTILRFYNRGTISREVALGLMLQAGVNVVAAGLFLENADLEAELRDRQQEIDIILDQFKVEEIGFSDANDKLNAIGLPSQELTQAHLDLEKLRIAKVKQPSKADLDKMLKGDLIPVEVYQTMLERQGYAPVWVDIYTKLIVGG